jgi:type IV pilus assembly protein PilN
MTNINLRPWREFKKERLKNEFIQITVVFAAFGAAVWLCWRLIVGGMIDHQESRNRVLQHEITGLDKKVKEIQELKAKKADLIERMRVIQDLQGTRPLIVHIFDQVAKTIPDGVYYSTLRRNDKRITIQATSESTNRISNLMRNMDESGWFTNPTLTKVTADTELGDQGNRFNLAVDVSPKEATDEEEGGEE